MKAGVLLHRRVLAHVAVIALVSSLLTVAFAPTAAAATIEVDTDEDDALAAADDSDCTLREAIEAANTNAAVDDCDAGDAAGTDVIQLEDEDYQLTEGDLVVSSDIEIVGEDVEDTTISGEGNSDCDGGTADSDRVFTVTSDTLTLQDLTVQDGEIEGSLDGGGAILAGGDGLVLDTVEITGNIACESGATDVYGGGISVVSGTLSLTDSTVSENEAEATGTGDGRGGGIYFSGSSFDIETSTLSGNTASGAASEGGGFWTDEDGSFVNSTISGNTADSGGGIFVDTANATAVVSMEHVTITDNDDAGLATSGPAGGTGVVQIEASIIGDQDSGDDCELGNNDDVDSGGYNLSSDDSCNFDDGDDEEDADIDLDSLDDNGGPTETHLPDSSSDAVDLIDESDCTEDEDQRGEDRDDDCDAGAVELQSDEDDDDDGGSSTPDDELDVTPETATNTLPGDRTHTVTALLDEDELDDDDEDQIDFKIISGPNEDSDEDEADFECSLSSDRCSISYTSDGTAGTDIICAWVDTDDDDSYRTSSSSSDGGDCDTERVTPSGSSDDDFTDVVQKSWVLPTTTTSTTTSTSSSRPTPPPGRTIRVGTAVLLDFLPRPDVFKGTVFAAIRRCVRRVVTLKRVDRGPNTTVDRTTSRRRSGDFRFDVGRANGRYYVTVARKVYTAGNGDTVICQWAKSDRVKA